MEPICKTAATALFSFGLLFSIMLITFDSNLLSLSSWHLFQTFLQNKQKNNIHAQVDHNAQNGTIKKLRTPEEKSRSNIFEQNMAEVFRSRVEQVQLACRDMHGDSNMTRSNTWIIKSTLKLYFSAWVKITMRQGKLQGKSVTRRVCLSFASAIPTHNCWSIIEQKNFASFRWSVGPGSRLLMCSTGKHGTNTWARWQFSNRLLCQAFDFFYWYKHFSYFLGLYGLSNMSGNGSVKQQVSNFVWI